VLPLARHFLERFAHENGKTIDGFDASALARIESYTWPGNVRELENLIERAVVLCDARRITAEHLPVVPATTRSGLRIPGVTLRDLERHAILGTLEAMGGSTSRAAKVLGISVRKIQYRLQEYGMAMKRVTSPSVASTRYLAASRDA